MNMKRHSDGNISLLIPDGMAVEDASPNMFITDLHRDKCIAIDLHEWDQSEYQSFLDENRIESPPADSIECVYLLNEERVGALAYQVKVGESKVKQTGDVGHSINCIMRSQEFYAVVGIGADGNYFELKDVWDAVLNSIEF